MRIFFYFTAKLWAAQGLARREGGWRLQRLPSGVKRGDLPFFLLCISGLPLGWVSAPSVDPGWLSDQIVGAVPMGSAL